MFNSANSRRNALMMSIGWWYLRRLIRQRGTAAVAGYVAGEGLSFSRRSHKRHPLRWLAVIGLVGVGGLFWWRKRQGGGDDWGDWEPVAPVAPVAPMPVEPEPTDPGPVPDPEPTLVTEADPAGLVTT
jgi:hypothetical protein